MRQQINLLTEELRPKKELFPIAQLGFSIALFGVVLLGISAIQGIGLWNLHSEKTDRSQSLAKLKGEISKYESKAAIGPNQQLVKMVERLYSERNDHRLLQLSLKRFETSNGFAGFMDDIAIHHVEGMWLTRILLRDGGSSILMEGKTRAAEYLPTFLSALSQGQYFQGQQFDGFEVEAQEDGLLSFLISGPEET